MLSDKRTLETPASVLIRALQFLDAYRAAPADADITLRRGTTEGGEPAIVISINDEYHGFTVPEARVVADAAEEAMNKYPTHTDAGCLPNLIRMLRHGADIASTSLPEIPPNATVQ